MTFHEFMKQEPHEFNIGDEIIQIGHEIPAKVIGLDEHHYYLRWKGHGDSMIWISSVDEDYVKV